MKAQGGVRRGGLNPGSGVKKNPYLSAEGSRAPLSEIEGVAP